MAVSAPNRAIVLLPSCRRTALVFCSPRSNVPNGQTHAEHEPERSERRGHEDGDEKTHRSHHDGSQGGSAQEPWKGICG
jgi:hypothetical protein